MVAVADVVSAIRLKNGIEDSAQLTDIRKILLFDLDGFNTRLFDMFSELTAMAKARERKPESAERHAARLVTQAENIGQQIEEIEEQLNRPGRNEESFPPGFAHRARRTLRNRQR